MVNVVFSGSGTNEPPTHRTQLCHHRGGFKGRGRHARSQTEAHGAVLMGTGLRVLLAEDAVRVRGRSACGHRRRKPLEGTAGTRSLCLGAVRARGVHAVTSALLLVPLEKLRE